MSIGALFETKYQKEWVSLFFWLSATWLLRHVAELRRSNRVDWFCRFILFQEDITNMYCKWKGHKPFYN